MAFLAVYRANGNSILFAHRSLTIIDDASGRALQEIQTAQGTNQNVRRSFDLFKFLGVT